MKRTLLLFFLCCFALLRAETAADKIVAGRAALAARDLPTAKARFQEALVLNPQSQVATALLGFTRGLGILQLPAVQAAMDRGGVAANGRDVYQWSADLTYDANDRVVLPVDYNLTEFAVLVRATLLPELERIRTDFEGVTNESFLLTLSPAETGAPASITFDYADLLMARAWVRGAEFLFRAGLGQNVDAQLGALQGLFGSKQLTFQGVLLANANFLKAGSASDRAAARATLLDAVQLYRQASVAVRARPVGVVRFFTFDPANAEYETKFRADLDSIERSLTEFVPFVQEDEPVRSLLDYVPSKKEDVRVRLGALFEADWSLRNAFPTVSQTGFDFTTITDTTVGGAILGVSRETFTHWLTSEPRSLPEAGWQWVSPISGGNTLNRHVALENGRRVLVGAAGAILVSDDGLTWTSHPLSGHGALAGVAAGNGKIVAVGDGGTWLSSDQGLTWHSADESVLGYGRLRSVAFGAGRFVVISHYSSTAVSTDGEHWRSAYLSDYAVLSDVIFTGDQFVAVGNRDYENSAVIYTSSDGLVWARRFASAVSGSKFFGVAQGGGKTVAVGNNGNCAVSSNAGGTWTSGTIPFATTTSFHGIGYRNGLFVAVGDGGVLATSPDGVTWTSAASGEVTALLSVSPAADAIYVTGVGGVLLRSTDGSTFARVLPTPTTTSVATTWLSLRAVDGYLYAVGKGGKMVRSSDGQVFAAVSSGTTSSLWSLIGQDGTLYVVGDGGTILVSTNGTTWTARASGTTADLRSISYLNGEFIVTGANGTLLTSADGLTWTARTTGATATLYSAAYGSGRYVAVGDGQRLTSTDRINWTVVDSFSLRAVVFHDAAFTAVGLDGIELRSLDGVSWSYLTRGYGLDVPFLRVLNGRYCALRTATATYDSASQSVLEIWSGENRPIRLLLGTADTHYSAEYFQGRLYTAGTYGQILRSAPIPAFAAPTLRVITPDTFARQGDRLALLAAANGEGSFSYQWKKDGVVLAGATDPMFVLGNVQPADAGGYTLTATNAAGSATSTTIVVTVDAALVAPTIVAQPQSQTVNVGLSPAISVVVAGTAPFSYVWKKDGVVVPGATGATLAIAAVQTAHAGNYLVVVTNVAGTVTSRFAALNVDSNPAYTFSTLAGLAGFSGSEDGTGSAARFTSPGSVAVDGAGNVYVADAYRYTVRKITPAGVVTTFAGQTGSSGTADGVGAAARFSYVRALAVDPAGANLYVGDTKLRKISLATRAVTTLPGDFGYAKALVADGTGNVFAIGDQPAIYRISPAGVATLLAGSDHLHAFADGIGPTARFYGPQGLALDSAGNLYVADSYNFAIRKVTPDGTVSTLAGRPGYPTSLIDGSLAQATFPWPTGLVVDAAGAVLVLDGSVLRRISAGIVRTIGGRRGVSGSTDGVGTSALFSGARSLAIDSANNLYVADEWNYTVRKGTLSASPFAPAILTAAPSQLALTGGSATFSVAVAGFAPFSYQWKKDGADLAGATDATLSLSNLQLAQAGAYTVRVTNAHGTALSPAAALSVVTPPSIAVQPPPRTNVPVGQPVLLTVTAAGSGPLAYQWSRNGTSIIEATSASYSIPVAALGDSGSYTVLVANAGGSVTSATAAVLAYVVPTLANLPSAQTVNTGATATFTVGASGSPPPVFQWRRNGVPLLGATTNTLTLANVQPAEAGTYSVTVSNAGGSIVSAGVDLTVVLPAAAPAITAQPLNSSATAGRAVALSVAAVGNATLLYQWRKNGTPIDGATAAALNFASVQLADAATYSVVVTNSAGSATSRDAILSVVPSTFGAVHAATGRGYVAGKTARITTTISYSGVLTGLGCQVLLPPGWSFASGDGATATSSPAVGAVDVLEWDWSTVPASPLTLTYIVNVPLATTGAQNLSSLVTTRPGPIQFLAQTDPLVLTSVTLHTGDTDGDFSFGLFELTRVIELYNTRRDTTRTGAYAIATSTTEDGFTTDPVSTGSANIVLSRYHTADTNRDGRLSLTELTRVIELFNTRSGTARTGAYHAQPGTEDGFAPGS